MIRLKIVGERFGRLEVLRFSRMQGNLSLFWCKCDCGVEKEVIGSCMKRGLIKSCGCLAAENASKRTRKHGESMTKLYKVWRHMIERCTQPTCKEYKRYGARGIYVCDEWLTDYFKFKSDVGSGYAPGLEFDRPNNNDGYHKGNFRWTTHKVNNNNKRTNCYIEYNGETKTATEWAEIYGLNRKCISERVRHGKKGADAIWGPYYLKRLGKHKNG